MGATSVGGNALFAGGLVSSTRYSTVDAYSPSLVRTTPAALSVARDSPGAASVNEFALFAGGGIATPPNRSNVVDYYDSSLVKGTTSALSAARSNIAGVALGNYMLFGGGTDTNNANCAIVDVYSVT
jgi:hypothetical protein